MPQHKNIGLISDQQIFLAISEGSEAAFRMFFERYRQRMWTFVMTIIKSPHIAEDIVQESFIKLWECRNMLADVEKPNVFIFVLVKNRAFDALRKLVHEEEVREQVWEQIKQQSAYSDYWLEAEQAEQILGQIIARLPAQQQKILHLSRELGLSHQEIANQLKISKNTVKNHIVAALKTCREQLKRMGFSYFFLLPLVLLGPVYVLNTYDNKRINENKEKTVGGTVEEIQHQHLQ